VDLISVGARIKTTTAGASIAKGLPALVLEIDGGKGRKPQVDGIRMIAPRNRFGVEPPEVAYITSAIPFGIRVHDFPVHGHMAHGNSGPLAGDPRLRAGAFPFIRRWLFQLGVSHVSAVGFRLQLLYSDRQLSSCSRSVANSA